LSDQQAPPTNGSPEARQVALAERRHVQNWVDPEWQRLWLTVDGLAWRTLALIPAGRGGPADFTLSLAVTLSRTGMTHVGGPILVADGTQVPLNQLNAFLADVKACTDGGERVIIALSEASDNPVTPAMARAADGVVLCVLLEHMRSSDAKQTIKAIGAAKFLGSVIVRPESIGHGK
jgi:hypothetical protein